MYDQINPKYPDTPARCIIDWGDGLPPQETIISAAMAPAFVALCRVPMDAHRCVLSDPAPLMQPDASYLHGEAVGVSYMAQAFRAARWAGKAPPRLSDELFGLRHYGPPLPTAPATPTLAGLYYAGHALKLPLKEHAALQDRFLLLFALSHRAPSVSPIQEAPLIGEGYSSSEFVAVKLADHVLHLSGLYRTALESPQPEKMLALDPDEHDVKDLLKHACDAERLARDALRVIKDGVAYGTGKAQASD